MTINEHFSEFGGLPVVDFDGTDLPEGGLPAADSVAWRVSTDYDGPELGEVFARFLRTVDTRQVTALLIGFWGGQVNDDSGAMVTALVEAADRFPNLRSLFFGDIVMEESEISWIVHSDITPLLGAFPRLERFGVRGGDSLKLSPIRSPYLRELRFESGGLPAEVARAVAESDLPGLEHLELWLGDEEYGGEVSVADLAPILGGERLPALRHLGLQNAEIQDEIAAAVAAAPVVARLTSLSLAMGVLSDQGATALLSGQPLTHLKRLDLHHHYLSDAMMERLRGALPEVEIDLGEQETADEYGPYVAVAE